MKRLGGWWRLWVFLSVLWGVGVVVVVVADWPGNVAKRVLSEEDMKLLSPQTQKMLADAKSKEVLDLLAKDNIFDEPSKPRGMPWERFQKAEAAKRPNGKPWESAPAEHRVDGMKPSYTIPPAPDDLLLIPYVMRSGQELRLLCGNESLDAVKQDYERVQVLALRYARFSKVGYALLAWLMPCLTILALGLGFRWVVRGFKKETAT